MALAGPQPVPSPSRRENRRPKNYVDNKAGTDPLKVQVSGFPPYTRVDDLKDVFSSYGDVNIKLMKNYAIVTLPDGNSSKKAIASSKKICVYGEFLTVKPYKEQLQPEKNKMVFVRSKEKNKIIEPSKLDLSGDFLQQLDHILAAVRLTQEDVASISRLYSDLENVLRGQWPGCQVYPFGSITTGLGIKTSDADCLVDLPPQYKQVHINHVNKAKRLLQQFPNIFKEIFSIPNAHTPIVKFFYVPTQTNCDVSFKTLLGVRNSKLIAFLLHTDPRLILIAVIIKYWGKVHGFSGGGKLSNYALTMLFIFYLQQKPISILPSVEWLQRDSLKDFIVDEWNTGFIDQHDLLPKSENKFSILEILGGFFEYYANFNFEEMVVCPFLGYPIKKSAFADQNSLPEEMGRYKRNLVNKATKPIKFTTSMCVQDPLELCHNVASSVSMRLSVEIKLFFKFAAAAYQQDKDNKCVNFFKTILLQKPVLPGNKARTEYKATVNTRGFDKMDDDEWKAVIRNVITIMFEQISHAKLDVEEETKQDDKKCVEQYTTTVTKAIWKRKKFTRIYNHMPGSFLEKQIQISNEIINTDKEIYDLKMRLIVSYPREARNVAVRINYLDGDKMAFQEFGKFFIVMTKGWFYVLMRPFMKTKGSDTSVANVSTDSIEDKINLTNGLVNKDEELNDSETDNTPGDTGNDSDANDVDE